MSDDVRKGAPDDREPPTDENQIVAERRGKLATLRAQGQPYPNDFRRDALAGELHAKYGALDNATLEPQGIRVAVAGRMVLKRVMGKACFATLQDMTGRIQLYVTTDGVGAATLDAFKHWDLGDIIGATGTLFKTRTGELSVRCDSIRLLVKALRPLPEKFHGLSDQEQKYRQRYVDLITNPASREIFVKRSQIVQAIREFFVARGYLEVETPMMQTIPGGAAARPFTTHHNALDMTLYLRIAPELYLKRLVVGGMEKVFEINRNFRNEGISTRHNPEFTMLEFYWAYADVNQMMDFCEAMLRAVVYKALGHTHARYGEHDIDFSQAFERLSMKESVAKLSQGQSISDEDVLRLFESKVEPMLVRPTFIHDYPKSISPLSKASPGDPAIAERFELFVAGMECANGFSELNDPAEQYQRFNEQMQQRERGDEEAMVMDEDYIRALSYGMPPAAGIGIGIDRFVMLLTNRQSIRDVILFPHLRPERRQEEPESEPPAVAGG